MKQSTAGYIVNLNKETHDLLMEVKEVLKGRLGFEPTNGQVVRHLIAHFFDIKN